MFLSTRPSRAHGPASKELPFLSFHAADARPRRPFGLDPRIPVPTILSHPAVPLALAAIAGQRHVSARLLAVGVIASVLPDADVLAFRLGVPYASDFGHRGFSHSLLFALAVGVLALAFAPALRCKRLTAFLFVTISCASHGLLDMLTNGGHGVAYLWPFSDERFFFPSQVIEVSTLNLRRFFGPAGLTVLLSELRWIWLPAAAAAALGILLRRKNAA